MKPTSRPIVSGGGRVSPGGLSGGGRGGTADASPGDVGGGTVSLLGDLPDAPLGGRAGA